MFVLISKEGFSANTSNRKLCIFPFKSIVMMNLIEKYEFVYFPIDLNTSSISKFLKRKMLNKF